MGTALGDIETLNQTKESEATDEFKAGVKQGAVYGAMGLVVVAFFGAMVFSEYLR